MDECPHKTLKRRNVGNQHWYACANPQCGQKFVIDPWDGKMQVYYRDGTVETAEVEKAEKQS